MTTAREKLYEEVIVLLGTPPGDGAPGEMRKIMSRYRVQTKPGIDVPPEITARDALGDRLLALWRAPPDDAKTVLGNMIDQFRMQLKGAGGPAKPGSRPTRSGKMRNPSSKGPQSAIDDDDDSAEAAPEVTKPNAPARRSATAPASLEPAPAFADKSRSGPRAVAEPVAGGPRKRGRSRGECPKCKSMGVVLARSYAGDEYFSCIYCGWQAYKPTEEDDPNASLAVRLLGQTAGGES